MTEIVIFASAHKRQEREILRAACEWVRSISDHPNLWSGEQEQALIRTVRTAYPNIRCKWVDDPRFDGWADSTNPGVTVG